MLARKFGVDSQVLSVMFIGYIVLLLAGGFMLIGNDNGETQGLSEITGTQESTTDYSLQN